MKESVSIRSCLLEEFPGAWGSEPGYEGPNVRILRSTNLDDDGHINFATAANRLVAEPHLSDRRLKTGDILLEASGGGPGKPVGRIAHFQQPDDATYLTSNFFRTLRPNPEKVHSKFLAWRLLGLYRQSSIWNFQQQTTGIINLKTKHYLEQRFDLPAKAQQAHIAAILDTADETIAKTVAVIAKLRQVRTGLIHDLLTCGLDENGHLRDPISHPEQFQETSLGLLPSTWQIVSVDTAGEVRLGRQRSPAYDHGEFMFPYLRVANVFDCFIDFSDVLRMNFTPQERAQYGLLPGDILLNEGQSLELVGRSAVYRGEPGGYCFQNSLVRFRANLQVAVPDYCQLVFHHWLHTGRFTTVAKQTTSVAHLGADRFAKMTIALPTPSEQREIAAMLSHQDQLIAATETELTKLQAIKSGLMDDLLTGRVLPATP